MKSEPRIHSHITDKLPEDHPRAYDGIDCRRCGKLLHAFNNECMRTWVETGKGNYCLPCFTLVNINLLDEHNQTKYGPDFAVVLEDEWGLEESEN